MPSPLGHALGGVIVALVLAPPPLPYEGQHKAHHGRERHGEIRTLRLRVFRGLRVAPEWWPMVGWCAVAACLPDLDFTWGRHNMETHSVGFALMLGAATLARRRSAKAALACALAVSTHVLFDWLGSDDVAPLGVMALWPLTSEFFYSDAWLFGAISRHYWRSDFVSQNVLAVLRELLILGPFVAALWFYRREKFATNNTPDPRVHARSGDPRKQKGQPIYSRKKHTS